MPIRILDESIANKISAGEVIERPASVVKELVENSLDAGATEIAVEIEEAGRALIAVADDGCGMTREDAVLSLQRHATSKISTAEDLFAIRTLGFRGEALPSIAAVSFLRLVTRPHAAESGIELLSASGTITDVRDVGAPPGTRFEVRRLFHNTPARLKFLRRDETETGHVLDLLNALAISRPDVGFRLLNNGREVLRRPPSDALLAPISAWLGRPDPAALVPVALVTPGISVDGFIGRPDLARGNRAAQLFFVNGRRIVSRALSHALESAARELIAPGRYPVAALRVTLDPEQVDVNVHPAKAEVRFHREGEVYAAVARAVRDALAGVRMVRELAVGLADPAASRRPAPPPPATPQRALDLPSASTPSASLTLTTSAFTTSALRAIGQLRATFLLAEGRDGLLIINQHRAHERVIFERLYSAPGRVASQRLLTPASLHLPGREADLLARHLDALASYGFDMEPLSGGSFLVRAVPAVLAGADPEDVLREVVSDLDAGIAIAPFTPSDPAARPAEEMRRRLLASLACKAAVKANKSLAPSEQQALLDELSSAARPDICPHGDPIIMTVTAWELDRKFGR